MKNRLKKIEEILLMGPGPSSVSPEVKNTGASRSGFYSNYGRN
jgi:hypothetical protein